MKKECLFCHKIFEKKYYESRNNFLKKKFCCASCFAKHLHSIGKFGNKGKTRFKKGHVTWNKNTHGLMPSPWNKGKKGLTEAWNKGKTFIQIIGDKNPEWKGDNVSYRSLHKWVENHLGKPYLCNKCGKLKEDGRIEWASISHHAVRKLEDYMSLCVACHREYDRKVRI